MDRLKAYLAINLLPSNIEKISEFLGTSKSDDGISVQCCKIESTSTSWEIGNRVNISQFLTNIFATVN